MVYIKTLVSAFLLIVILGACSTNKSKSTESITPEGDGPIAAMPNPYLAQHVNAPAAAEGQFRKAVVLMQGENWDAAENVLTEMTQTYTDLSGPWVNLGICRAQKNNLEGAEEAFIRALEVNSLNNDAYIQFALLLREQGRFDEAEKVYLQALQVWPHNPQALRNLGILYDLYMGKFEQALAQYELAARLTPEPSRELQGWIIDLKRRLSAE